jgi:3-hydroxy-5-methyl-1-naphthoate 3-O-methyltransferase
MLEPPSADSRLIWDIYFSAHILPVVALADELGVFALFEATPLSVKEAATRLNVTDEWAEILLGALASLQLVRLQDGRFHNADAARSFLLPTSPYYAGFSLRRFATRNVWERLKRAVAGPGASASTAAAEVPESAPSVYVVRDWKEGDYPLQRAEEGVRTMHGLSFAAAVALARNADFSRVRRLLDVAGGSGGFSIALAQRNPQLRCTVAELPVVCQVTRRYIAEYGADDRVDTLPLNMFFEPWPSGYDAIFFSCVMHDWDLDLDWSSFDVRSRRCLSAERFTFMRCCSPIQPMVRSLQPCTAWPCASARLESSSPRLSCARPWRQSASPTW